MPRPKPERPCYGGRRHWFTRYGFVGSSAPECQRCGVENPNYDIDRDPWWVKIEKEKSNV